MYFMAKNLGAKVTFRADPYAEGSNIYTLSKSGVRIEWRGDTNLRCSAMNSKLQWHLCGAESVIKILKLLLVSSKAEISKMIEENRK